MYRQLEKNLLNSNISSRCSHNMSNFSRLTAEVSWRIWGRPANFSGFRVLALLLQQRRSPESNQTLHDVWPFPGLVHYIYIFRGLLPHDRILPGANFTFIQVLRSSALAALLHGSRLVGVSQAWRCGTRNGIRTFTDGATCIQLGGHHVGHQPIS